MCKYYTIKNIQIIVVFNNILTTYLLRNFGPVFKNQKIYEEFTILGKKLFFFLQNIKKIAKG